MDAKSSQVNRGPGVTGPSKKRSAAADYSSVTPTFKPVQGLGPIPATGSTQKINYGHTPLK
jgi:hypothetical protein